MTFRRMRDNCIIAFGAIGILCGFPEPFAWATFVIGFIMRLADSARPDVAVFIRTKER